ncbi:cold shock domain-containing protein [Chloroflexi bacterium TSY]|nr:cold shock domain-containing protein [Chloroflexi bacterium TSY]
MNGRVRGLVKWYNTRKRYGFIVRLNDSEVFAHGSALVGSKRLMPGDLVEFAIETDEQRSKAVDVRVLQRRSSKDS